MVIIKILSNKKYQELIREIKRDVMLQEIKYNEKVLEDYNKFYLENIELKLFNEELEKSYKAINERYNILKKENEDLYKKVVELNQKNKRR